MKVILGWASPPPCALVRRVLPAAAGAAGRCVPDSTPALLPVGKLKLDILPLLQGLRRVGGGEGPGAPASPCARSGECGAFSPSG